MAKNRDNPYIFFSWSGVFYILTIIVVFFMSRFRSNNSNLWILGVSLIVVGIVAIIQTNENMRHISIDALPGSAVPEDDEIPVTFRIINKSKQTRFAFALAFQKYRNKKTIEACVKASVHAVNENNPVLTLPSQKRGIVPIPPLLIWSFFPFGLCISWKRLVTPTYAVVYPRPEGISLLQHPDAGKQNDNTIGLSGIDDVVGLRRYQQGDSPNTIDWHLYARRGMLFVRSRDGGQGSEVELTWEQTQFLEDTEQRLRQLSRWIHDCQKMGIPFHLRLPGMEACSHRDIHSCFESLARFDTGSLL